MQPLLRNVAEAVASPPAVDEHGATLLHHAAKMGSVQLLEALIPLVTSPSHVLHAVAGLRTHSGASPLHVAAYHGQVDALKLLLNTPMYRAEVNGRDQWRQTPMHYAAIGGSTDAIEALAAAGASVDPQCERGTYYLVLRQRRPSMVSLTRALHCRRYTAVACGGVRTFCGSACFDRAGRLCGREGLARVESAALRGLSR